MHELSLLRPYDARMGGEHEQRELLLPEEEDGDDSI
jgi:hypothetical protein